MGDVPGMVLIPDPSLGGAPQVEGPTAHRLGAPCPAITASQLSTGRQFTPAQTSIRTRPDDGPPAATNSLLASICPQHPVEGVQDPEGFAFTAVSPFY